ncbi:MAG: hypothetical protein ACK4MM_05120, partial [Fervidobacterium sp.]
MKIKLNKKTLFLTTIGLVITGILITLFSLMNLPYTTAASANDTVEVSLNVSLLAEITVTPYRVEWLNIVPGYSASLQSLDIKNTGSVNFTKLWATVDSFAEETTNPLGQGNPLLYTAGSFLVLRNETGQAGYRFVNRMEWNETEKPTGMIVSPSDAVSWGYFRNFTDIYLWNFNDSATAGECLNGAQMTFKYKTTPESLTSPDRDMTAGDVVSGTFGSNNTEWGVWTFASGPLANYCVYVHKNCQKIMIAQWDYNASLPACNVREYLQSSPFESNEVHTFNLTVFIPRGIPVGNTTPSTLLIVAEE